MLEPMDTFPREDVVTKFDKDVERLITRRKKRRLIYRILMVFLWLFVAPLGFVLGLIYNH